MGVTPIGAKSRSHLLTTSGAGDKGQNTDTVPMGVVPLIKMGAGNMAHPISLYIPRKYVEIECMQHKLSDDQVEKPAICSCGQPKDNEEKLEILRDVQKVKRLAEQASADRFECACKLISHLPCSVFICHMQLQLHVAGN
jgi:hypothetical protein